LMGMIHVVKHGGLQMMQVSLWHAAAPCLVSQCLCRTVQLLMPKEYKLQPSHAYLENTKAPKTAAELTLTSATTMM